MCALIFAGLSAHIEIREGLINWIENIDNYMKQYPAINTTDYYSNTVEYKPVLEIKICYRFH